MDKYCKNCGNEITPQQVFCSKCGVKLTPQEQPTITQPNEEINETNGNSPMFLNTIDMDKVKSSIDKKEIIDGTIAAGISFTILLVLTAIVGLIFSTYVNNKLGSFGYAMSLFDLDGLNFKINPFDMMNLTLLNTYIIKMSMAGNAAKIMFSLRVVLFIILPIASVYLSLYILKSYKNKEKVSYNYLVSHGVVFAFLNLFMVLFTSKSVNLGFLGAYKFRFSYAYGIFIVPVLIFIIAFTSCKFMYKDQLHIPFLAFTKNILPLYKKVLILSVILVIPMLIWTLRSSYTLSFKSFIAMLVFMGLNLVAYLFISLFGVPVTINVGGSSSGKLLSFFVNGRFSFTSTLLYLIVIIGMIYLLYSYFNKMLKKNRENYFIELGKIVLTLSIFNSLIAYLTRINVSFHVPNETAPNFSIGASLLVTFITTLIVCGVIGVIVKYVEPYGDKYIAIINDNKKRIQLMYIIVLLVIACTNMLFIPSSKSTKTSKRYKKDAVEFDYDKKEREVTYDEINHNQHFILNNNEFFIYEYNTLYKINMKKKSVKKVIEFDDYPYVYVLGDKVFAEENGRLDIYSINGKKINKESIKTSNNFSITLDKNYIYSYEEGKLFTLKGEAKYRLSESDYSDLVPYKGTTLILTRNNSVYKYDLKSKKEEELTSNYAGNIFKTQNDIFYSTMNEEGNNEFISVNTGKSFTFNGRPILSNDQSWYLDKNENNGHALYKRDKDGQYNMVFDFKSYIDLDSYNGETGIIIMRLDGVPYLFDVNKTVLHDIELEMWEATKDE